jgi:hypothetical protein
MPSTNDPSSTARCGVCALQVGEQNGARGERDRIEVALGGFVHLGCRKAYFETDDVLDQVLHFSADLSDGERAELRYALATDPGR